MKDTLSLLNQFQRIRKQNIIHPHVNVPPSIIEDFKDVHQLENQILNSNIQQFNIDNCIQNRKHNEAQIIIKLMNKCSETDLEIIKKILAVEKIIKSKLIENQLN